MHSYNLYIVIIGMEFRQLGRVSGFEYSLMSCKGRLGKEREGNE